MTMNRAQRRAAARQNVHNRMGAQARMGMRVNPAAALNPILLSTPLTPDETRSMKLQLREAFEAIRTGAGTRDDFDHMVISYNAWQVLAENISTKLCEMMLPAGAALIRAKERVLEGKSLLWDGAAIEPMQQFMDIYDEIIDNVSPNQVQAAILEAHLRQTGKKLNWRK